MEMKLLKETDYQKLAALAQAMRRSQRPERASHLDRSLVESLVVEEEAFGNGLVAMGSEARIRDTASGETYTYRLVFPGDADVTKGLLSVLSPLGAALLGRRKGERFSYASPGGEIEMSVLSVETAPDMEKAGDGR